MTFTRVMIVYARDAVAHQQIERDLCDAIAHIGSESGYIRSEVLSEDDGLMVGLLTTWDSRETAQLFHTSGLSRLIMAVTEPHTLGAPVVQLFRVIC